MTTREKKEASASPKVSVIVPVYNVERYMEQSVRGLMEQTLDDVEYIFVDDCTPDGSMKVLDRVMADYPERQKRVKKLKTEVNSGQAAARTAGMKAATGEYMIHCDPDDTAEPDMLETLYNLAKTTGADVAECGVAQHRGEAVVNEGKPFSGSGIERLTGMDFNWGLYSKLVRTSLIKEHEIYPYEGINCGEDLNTIVRMLYHAGNVVATERALYHYNRNNESSITNSNRRRNIEQHAVRNMELIGRFIESTGDERLKGIVNELKFRLKSPMFSDSERFTADDARFWCGLWPESADYQRTNVRNGALKRRVLPIIFRHASLTLAYHRLLRLKRALSK